MILRCLFSFLVLTTVVQGAGSSQVIAGALPVPETTAGGAEFILVSNWPSLFIVTQSGRSSSVLTFPLIITVAMG